MHWPHVGLLAAAAAFALAPLPAAAALYEFSVGGTVESVTLLPGVSPGDPVVIRYTADDADLIASPQTGFYRATGATLTFPATTVLTAPGEVQVWLQPSYHRVFYYSVGEPTLRVDFYFPAGTLPTDALPLSLPLDLASERAFRLTPLQIPIEYASGALTSYASAEVPEPATFLPVGVACLLASRRRAACGASASAT